MFKNKKIEKLNSRLEILEGCVGTCILSPTMEGIDYRRTGLIKDVHRLKTEGRVKFKDIEKEFGRLRSRTLKSETQVEKQQALLNELIDYVYGGNCGKK